MLEISTTWENVRVGDVLFRGEVVAVSEPRTVRSGRPLMVVRYADGSETVTEPGKPVNLKRPE